MSGAPAKQLPVHLPVHIEHDDEPAAATPDSGRPQGIAAPFDESLAEPGTIGLWRALREVLDPELPVSIVDLGLIYGLSRDGRRAVVDLTFTAIACPCVEFIHADIRERLLAEDDVDEVEIREVWDPPWSRERMTETGRRTLRRLGVAA